MDHPEQGQRRLDQGAAVRAPRRGCRQTAELGCPASAPTGAHALGSPPSPGCASATAARRPFRDTPAGSGFAVKPPVAEGTRKPHRNDGPPWSRCLQSDFEMAARSIAEAQDAGLLIAAPSWPATMPCSSAIVSPDRFHRRRSGCERLRHGELVAVEVADPGGRVQVLSDPVAWSRLDRLRADGPWPSWRESRRRASVWRLAARRRPRRRQEFRLAEFDGKEG
jgi:hypothetical protein